MIILYKTDDDFYNGIEEMVKRGLRFLADAQDLSIELLGG